MQTTNNSAVDMVRFMEWASGMLAKQGDGFKFSEEMVARQPRLLDAAIAYLSTYQGTFEFLIDVQRFLYDNGTISDRQAKGVLNCVLAEIKRNRLHGTETDQSTIDDGRYTVVFNSAADDYVTLKLQTMTDGPFAGKQIASYLSGRDNDSDYTGFAFVNGNRVQIWKRFSGEPRIADALRMLVDVDRESRHEMGMAYALKSNNCWRCGRTLTVPASIHRGLGPICAEKIG